jgi:hypothetical protein
VNGAATLPADLEKYRYLSGDEAAALLGLSPGTLANWRCRGEGPPWTLLGRARGIRYRIDHLLAWVEDASKKRPAPPVRGTERAAR